MSEIYIIIKVAAQKDGEAVLATTEAAFQTAEQAKAFISGKPAVWDEVIQGMECTCERAVHTAILQ